MFKATGMQMCVSRLMMPAVQLESSLGLRLRYPNLQQYSQRTGVAPARAGAARQPVHLSVGGLTAAENDCSARD